MGFWEVVVIGIGLSMDACAVTVCNVMAMRNGGSWRELIWLPIAFGFFQALMPLLGYGVGSAMAAILSRFGPYLVAVVLGLIGLNMLRAAFTGEEGGPAHIKLTAQLILLQAVMTAIDALFVGVTFGALGVNPWMVLIIGCTTFILVSFAVVLGKTLGSLIGNKAELLGGILLLVVAIHALF